MNKVWEKLKGSVFFVNKIYLFIIFIGLVLTDATLGFYYFILSIILYAWKVVTSKVPMSTPKDVNTTPQEENKRIILLYTFVMEVVGFQVLEINLAMCLGASTCLLKGLL